MDADYHNGNDKYNDFVIVMTAIVAEVPIIIIVKKLNSFVDC